MNVQIRIDDLTDPRIAAFLEEHLNDMRATSPAESCHALDLEGLRKPEVTFWSAWDGSFLVGCGAIKKLDGAHAELKSMRTAPSHRGQGIGALVLRFIVEEARQRGYRRMSLETGSMEFFAPARRLYERHGFEYCEPFADYREDPNSVFMTLRLIAEEDGRSSR
jgi:putative acetyltransferase